MRHIILAPFFLLFMLFLGSSIAAQTSLTEAEIEEKLLAETSNKSFQWEPVKTSSRICRFTIEGKTAEVWEVSDKDKSPELLRGCNNGLVGQMMPKDICNDIVIFWEGSPASGQEKLDLLNTIISYEWQFNEKTGAHERRQPRQQQPPANSSSAIEVKAMTINAGARVLTHEILTKSVLPSMGEDIQGPDRLGNFVIFYSKGTIAIFLDNRTGNAEAEVMISAGNGIYLPVIPAGKAGVVFIRSKEISGDSRVDAEVYGRNNIEISRIHNQ